MADTSPYSMEGVPTVGFPIVGPTINLSPAQAQQIESWHTAQLDGKYARFFPIAEAFADMSKYPGTKVGAVVLGPTFEVRASGWNGAPRGSSADKDQRLKDRATRLTWAVHAEANAIANAARCGTPLDGCAIVVTAMPCMSCAKLIVQSGITRVFTRRPTPEFEAKWAEDFAAARSLFIECGVQLVIIGE